MKGRKALREAVAKRLFDGGCHASMTLKQDGTFVYKKTYFYHHGQTPETVAFRILQAIPEAIIVEKEDAFANWPKTSYLIVRFRMPEGKEAAK
jgi:hypothetical protein